MTRRRANASRRARARVQHRRHRPPRRLPHRGAGRARATPSPCTRRKPPAASSASKHSVPASSPSRFPASPQPGDLRAVRGLRRALATDGADIVHAHGLRAGLVAGWARPEGVPLVVTWHNAVLAGGLRARAYHLLERRVARIADVTLGASGDLVDRARALGARRRASRRGRRADAARPPAATPAEVRAELAIAAGRAAGAVGRAAAPAEGLRDADRRRREVARPHADARSSRSPAAARRSSA